MEDKKQKIITAREMKKAGLKILKTHYILLVLICLLAALLHTEYGDVFSGLQSAFSEDGGESGAESAADDSEAVESSSGMLDNKTAADVLHEILVDSVESGEVLSEQIAQQEIENAGNPIMGRSRGVMSAALNFFSSGALWVKVVLALRNISHSDTFSKVAAIFGALFVYLFYWIFIQCFYKAVMYRFFLEARTYKRVPYTRFFYFQQVHRWVRSSLTLVLTEIFLSLWSLTIIGIIIKQYSYFLVPYIVAENPDIKPRQAITLSRRMMDGHKWDCFVKQLTFIGWSILDSFTLGLLGIFFLNPYLTASFTEYYVKLRDEAKRKNIPGAELLNDTYLYEKAGDEELAAAYAVEKKELAEPRPEEPVRSGFFDFIADWFGIVLRQTPEEVAYEKSQAGMARLSEAESVLEKESYPIRLVIPGRPVDSRVEGIYYMRNYTVTTVIFLFLIMSLVGWLWEVSLHLIETGVIVNRGVLHGPWLPIYGTGAVLVILILKRFRSKPGIHFAATMLLCGFVEYYTGWFLEFTHDGQKWWDYSGYFLNLQGRVCAEGLLAFGIIGTIVIYLLAPALDTMTRRLPFKQFTIIVAVVFCIFMIDNIYSSSHPNMGEGITDTESGGDEEKTESEGEEDHSTAAFAGVVSFAKN